MMNHKISDMCDVISVMYDKSMMLRRLKYDLPEHEVKKPEIQQQIQVYVDDIQALALLIAHDRRK